MSEFIGDIPGVLDAPQGAPAVRQELPKLIVGLNKTDLIFKQQACQALNLYIDDHSTAYIWEVIIHEVTRQCIDMYTYSPQGYLFHLKDLPNLKWFQTELMARYYTEMQSAEFADACRVYGVHLLVVLQRQAFPLDRYDLFLETYWEGAIVLGVYTKTITYPLL